MLLALMPAVILTSCDNDDEEITLDDMAMVVHASPDAPGVDLLSADSTERAAGQWQDLYHIRFARGFVAPPSGNSNALGAEMITHN